MPLAGAEASRNPHGQVPEHRDDRTGGNDAMPRIKSRKKHQSKPESEMNFSHLFVTGNVASIK